MVKGLKQESAAEAKLGSRVSDNWRLSGSVHRSTKSISVNQLGFCCCFPKVRRLKSKSRPAFETKRWQLQTKRGADQIMWIKAVFAFTSSPQRGFLFSKFGFKDQSLLPLSWHTHLFVPGSFAFQQIKECTWLNMHTYVWKQAQMQLCSCSKSISRKDLKRMKGKGEKKIQFYTLHRKRREKHAQKQIHFLADGALFMGISHLLKTRELKITPPAPSTWILLSVPFWKWTVDSHISVTGSAGPLSGRWRKSADRRRLQTISSVFNALVGISSLTFFF